jgi:tRNA pseudouridine38/39 synthase
LDIAAMQRAAEYLVGSHDFSNFCKMDVANVSNFRSGRRFFSLFFSDFHNLHVFLFVSRRDIYSAQIRPFDDSAADSSNAVWFFEVRGIAFLWHMGRCIMAVLFMVGGKDCDGGLI